MPPAMVSLSLNHWAAREFPGYFLHNSYNMMILITDAHSELTKCQSLVQPFISSWAVKTATGHV